MNRGSASARDPLARFLESQIAEGWMPGASWWVENRRGIVSRGALGSSTLLPSPEPATEATPYDLASLSKPLATALLSVLLEREHVLDLQAPLSDYLDELARSRYAGTRLLSLAAHTSGLPAWAPLYLDGASLEQYLDGIAGLPFAVEPGKTLYSDLGFILLGAVLERASGSSLDALFAERIAATVGAARFGFAGGGRDYRDAAATEMGNAFERGMAGTAGANHPFRAHVLRGEVHDANAHGLGGVAGHAGLFGTAEDVARLCRELLWPRQLGLDGGASARLLRVAGGGRCRTVGMVIGCCSSAARGILPDDAPGHTGFTGTSMWLDPRGERLFVLLTNRVHPGVAARNFQLLRRGFHRVAMKISG